MQNILILNVTQKGIRYEKKYNGSVIYKQRRSIL